MKYKVGDKVKIRSDLIIDKEYGLHQLGKIMDKYRGKIVEILAVGNSYYYIDKDNASGLWTDEMIEGTVEDMKTMKGWKLLKEIAEGNIKEGTKIKTEIERIFYFTNNRVFRDVETNELLTEVFNEYELATLDFEIIEDQEEINIQDIEELEKVTGFDTSESMKSHFNKINELVQAIKQLDKKIKEKE